MIYVLSDVMSSESNIVTLAVVNLPRNGRDCSGNALSLISAAYYFWGYEKWTSPDSDVL